MLKKSFKRYIKNKLNLCHLIRTTYKRQFLKSIIRNSTNTNNTRHTANILSYFSYIKTTNTVDVCLKSGVYKHSSKWTNFSRHEFHNLCRTNKLISRIVNSW